MYGGPFMSPLMGGATWLGPEVSSANFWPQAATQQPQAAVNPFGARGRTAALAALQKFAAAEEVRSAFDRPSVDKAKTAPLAPEEYERQRRVAAEAQAEVTVARLNAEGIFVSPVKRGNDVPVATGRDGAAENPNEMKTSAPPPGVLDSSEARYTGRIKTFNTVHGFGFIQSDAIVRLHGCDVFLNQAVEGGIVVGGQVTFSVEINKSGKPQARNVVLEKGVNSVEAPVDPSLSKVVGEVFNGHIKSFNIGRGLGFIVCPDLQRAFGGRDIYLSKTHAPEGRLTAGQEVKFSLWIDRKGQPQARNVELVKHVGMPGVGLALSSAADNSMGWRLFSHA